MSTPRPGPISRTMSSDVTCEAWMMVSMTEEFVRKFWPRLFLAQRLCFWRRALIWLMSVRSARSVWFAGGCVIA